MSASSKIQPDQKDATDRDALLLMLAYVEAECLRMGASDAARHAAQAAALLPSTHPVEALAPRYAAHRLH